MLYSRFMELYWANSKSMALTSKEIGISPYTLRCYIRRSQKANLITTRKIENWVLRQYILIKFSTTITQGDAR